MNDEMKDLHETFGTDVPVKDVNEDTKPQVKPEHIVDIHGKKYVMVVGKLELAQKDLLSVETEIVKDTEDEVTVKATVNIKERGTFSGHATSNKKTGQKIEKDSPIEVAETSALGRALSFAGYGVLETIASAEEVIAAERRASAPAPKVETGYACATCGSQAQYKEGISKKGTPYKAVFCTADKTHIEWK